MLFSNNLMWLNVKALYYTVVICWKTVPNHTSTPVLFLHVFNDISTYAYVFTVYFLHSFSNLSIKFHVVL